MMRVSFDDILSSDRKMNLFSYFFCTFIIVESWAARNIFTHCPPISGPAFGRVRFRQRGKIARFLCNTGYTLAGDRYSVCTGGQWETAITKCVRATCKPAKAPSNVLIYPSYAGAVLNFYCKSGYELRGLNITYCDGFHWDNPLPNCLPTNTKPSLFCDFEKEDICGWNHDLNHDFNWKRLNFATPSGSIGTGPSHDHTKGADKDGYYMYIESSSRRTNDTARLISPVYDKANETTCFEFFYHMYGAAIGSLRIYLKQVDQSWKLNPKDALWVKSGNQGNKWYRGFVVLGTTDSDFQIVIEGVRGSSYVSDIAIDDVRIIQNCNPDEEISLDTTTEESFSSTLPVSVESCENRCNTSDNQIYDFLISCDCDDQCLDRNRCCPDYFDFCVIGTTEFEETIDFVTSAATINNTIIETTVSKTTRKTPTTKFTTPTTTTTFPRIKIATLQTTVDLQLTEEKDFNEIPAPVSTLPTEKIQVITIKETEVIQEYESDKTFDHHKIEIVPDVNESNMKTIVFAVGVVFGILFALGGTAFVAKRYRLCQCKIRLQQSSSCDSQSDVRFLTHDEVLDLRLASDYDLS